MSELLPCPFCGAGQTITHINQGTWTGMKYGEPVSVEIRHWCEKVEGQPERGLIRIGRDEASAIAAWNRRAQPAQSAIDAAARIEALELAVERNHGTINIISGALSATEKELATWRSKAGTLENELRRARCDIDDAIRARTAVKLDKEG